MSKGTSITIEISAQEAEQIAALHAHVPLTSRHAVARTALVLGLHSLTKRPEQIAKLIVALRERRNGNSKA